MKIMWESGGIAPALFTSVLGESEWWASRPSLFTPGEIASPVLIWQEVGWTSELVWMQWSSENFAMPGNKPGPFSPKPVAIPTELSRLCIPTDYLLKSFCLYKWNNPRTTDRIFMKSDIVEFN
jgi:hypothetical protein